MLNAQQTSTQTLTQSEPTFRDLFRRMLDQNPGSRPPRTLLKGILTPQQKMYRTRRSDFTLGTKQNEFGLVMNDSLRRVAKKMEWEEVAVTGYFEPTEGFFKVEKISSSSRAELQRANLIDDDLYFEIEQYRKSIGRNGSIPLGAEHLAS